MNIKNNKLVKAHWELWNTIKNNLSPARFEHSVRVAELSSELARKYKINEEHAWLAGIAHDVCREYSEDKILLMAEEFFFRNIISDYIAIYMSPKLEAILYHGLAGNEFLEQYYPLSHDVYKAIAAHTLGHPHMDMLEKILFIADSLEPARVMWNEKEREEILDMCIIDIQVARIINKQLSVYGNVHPITKHLLENIVRVK